MGAIIGRQELHEAESTARTLEFTKYPAAAMIAQPDAARAVLPALTVTSGTYNVTSGRPVTQATLNARLAAAAGKDLAPLYDPHWGDHGILFGHSRMIIDSTFCDLTGWRPQIRGSADNIASMLSGTVH
jgi:nucleoside-diphosphate-sugar epimerase